MLIFLCRIDGIWSSSEQLPGVRHCQGLSTARIKEGNEHQVLGCFSLSLSLSPSSPCVCMCVCVFEMRPRTLCMMCGVQQCESMQVKVKTRYFGCAEAKVRLKSVLQAVDCVVRRIIIRLS